jgi:hypothetical protein
VKRAVVKVLKREGDELWVEGIDANYVDSRSSAPSHIITKLKIKDIKYCNWYTSDKKVALTKFTPFSGYNPTEQ